MFNLLCICLHVFCTIPSNGHTSLSTALVCIATVLKCEKKNKESNYNVDV